jgi:hypothetical protein
MSRTAWTYPILSNLYLRDSEESDLSISEKQTPWKKYKGRVFRETQVG